MKAEHAHCYEDLLPCRYFQWLDDREPKLRAIGWLARNHPYKRGKPDSATFQKLLALLASPWAPVCIPRRPECPFCPIISPEHMKKKKHWWVLQQGVTDGVDLPKMHTPETVAHANAYRLAKSGANACFETTNLYVPANGFVFVAHAMIAHFVDAHGYDPPAEFWEAVRNCPVMDSLEYLKALMFNGPRNKLWPAAVWAGSVLRIPDEDD
jgi:hypothetical protein